MALIFGSSPLRIAASRWVGPKRATHAMPSQLSAGHGPLESWPGPQGAPSKPCFDGEFDWGYRCVSSGSGASLGAVRRNFMSPSPVALPARFLKESAAVSTTPTFSATAAVIHWFNDTPFSCGSRWAAFLMERGSFNG